MIRPAALAAPVLLALLESGCVSVDTPGYPEYWPALATPATPCPDLSGLFDNADLNEKLPVRLAKWLLQTAAPLDNVHRVRLVGPRAGVLSMGLLDAADAELLARDLREGTDYSCRDGWLESSPKDLQMIGVVSQQRVGFARTVRGDLAVRHLDTGGGVVIVVPIYVSFRQWHLYRERSR